MDLNEYQQKARKTAIYPNEYSVIYPTLGLNGEAGEVAEKVKKVIRDHGGVYTNKRTHDILLELGDVMWYIANIASDLGISMENIAVANIEKLQSRKKRNTITGNGDNR